MNRTATAVLIAALLCSCGTSETPKETSVILDGRKCCAVHRVPLVTKDAFRTTALIEPDPGDEKFEKGLPYICFNLVTQFEKDARFNMPVKITYCVSCTEEFWKRRGAYYARHSR